MPGLVAVTGATGFIGQALISTLIRENWQIRALSRSPLSGNDQITWIKGSLNDEAALEQLVDGASAVVHCAGRVKGTSLDKFVADNATGTANLVRVSSTQPVPPRFLLISSLAARKPDLSWYASSKFEGEQSLRELAGKMPWTIFRPTAVYGPGDRELTPLFRLTRFGILPVTVSSSARFGLLYVDDLVSAILSWLKASSVPDGVYELDDGTPGGYDQYSVAAISSEVWGRSVYILPLPIVLIRVFAQINLMAARLLGYSPMLTPGKVEELQHPDWVCDITPLTEALGWLPANSLQEGIKLAVSARK